jgi:hypothetical protein
MPTGQEKSKETKTGGRQLRVHSQRQHTPHQFKLPISNPFVGFGRNGQQVKGILQNGEEKKEEKKI